jgi:Response regulator containing CheY-like receiver, AAA-type ATPase, and DNA-binding domains
MASEIKSKKDTHILVVDDEPEIRELISDFLVDCEGYTVYRAESGPCALQKVLPENHVDLILSDINMPVMKGFELLKEVRERYPVIKRILITAYNVEDYLELAMKHDIGNIFVKTTPFNFQELSRVLDNLLGGDIFGIRKYFDEPNTTLKTTIVRHGNNLEADAAVIISHLPPVEKTNRLELVLIELLANAIFYGIRKESAEKKENWTYDFELAESEAIVVNSMFDKEKFAISISDKGGRLNKHDVLYWLHRQLKTDDAGVPLGLYDSHGRGLYIARQYIDRMIVNIDKNKQTEIIIMNYLSDKYFGYKPLYINEL